MLNILAIVLALLITPAKADACAYEAQEARITEELTKEPDREYFVIEGELLDLFVKNINDLYNVGLVREQIGKIYIIDQAMHPKNPNFQGVHMFVLDTTGCIGYYQTTYKVVIKLLLSDDPHKLLEEGIK